MTESDISTISRVRYVGSATYANLPTTNLQEGDLGFATDRKVLFRWSGAAWSAITISSFSGVFANRPAIADVPEGSLYYSTDTFVLYQAQAGVWVSIVAPIVQKAFTEYLGASSSQASDASWQDWDISAQVPAGTVAVEIAISISYPDSGSMSAGVRNNGSALARTFTISGGGSSFCSGATEVTVISQVDANRVLERYSTAKASVSFRVIGYWS